MRIYLNRNWNFIEEFTEKLITREVTSVLCEQVIIPHTVKETPFHYFDESEYQMVSGYYRELFVPEEWNGKNILLTFEGVAHTCEVYLNGELIGEHYSGYTAFTMKLENLRYGEQNIVVVKVDSRESLNIPPFGHVIDYMTYGGIYRDVYLDVKDSVYMEDVFLYSDLQSLYAVVTRNTSEVENVCQISLVEKGTESYEKIGQATLRKQEEKVSFSLPKVKLWDIDNPNLYDVKVELLKDNQVIDEKVVTFGFRKVEFKSDGFYLNDKKVKIRGLNRHQSYPYVGYAMSKSMQCMDADVLKE